MRRDKNTGMIRNFGMTNLKGITWQFLPDNFVLPDPDNDDVDKVSVSQGKRVVGMQSIYVPTLPLPDGSSSSSESTLSKLEFIFLDTNLVRC